MEYKIVSFDEKTGFIGVNCNSITITLELPIVDGNYIEGEELDIFIRKFIPESVIERNESITNGVGNVESIRKLVVDGDYTLSTEQKAAMIRDKRNTMLKNTDWTQISDNNLTDEQRLIYADYRQQLRDITLQDGFPENIEYIEQPRF